MLSTLSILYLLAISFALFLVHHPIFVVGILLLHLGLIIPGRIKAGECLRLLWRQRFLFAFLICVQCVFPPRSHFLVTWFAEQFPTTIQWFASAAETGMRARPSHTFGAIVGLYQSIQIFTMVLVSAFVRRLGEGSYFRRGLENLFVPRSSVELIDACMRQLEDRPGLRRGRGGRGKKRAADLGESDGGVKPFRAMMRGDVGWILDRLEANRPDAGKGESQMTDATRADADARILSRITLVLMSLRMLKVTPGTGLTPGHQNVIVIPLLCLAAERTSGRWAATSVGTASGVLAAMLGLGRNGIFVIPAHVFPGIIVDLFWPIVAKHGSRRTACVLIGVFAGFARFSGMLIVLSLLGNPELFAAVPFLSLGHVVFGVLGGLVAHKLVSAARIRDAAASLRS